MGEPQVNVELPDGTILQDVPDGTTKEQLRQKLARNGYDVKQLDAADADPRAGMGAGMKFLVGAGATADRAKRGIMGLVGMGDPGKDDAALYEKYHPGGWATAGEVTADVGMTALPGVKIAQGARGLGTLGRIGANVGGNAAVSAALAPDDERLGSGVAGGVGAGAGMALAKVLPLATRAGRDALRERSAGRFLVGDIGGPQATRAEARAAAGGVADSMENYLANRSGLLTEDMPLTAAQTLRQAEGDTPVRNSLALAMRQLGTQGNDPASFGQLLREQNKGLHDVLGVAGREADDLGANIAARDAVTGPLRTSALQAADASGTPLNAALAQFSNTLSSGSIPHSPERAFAKVIADVAAEPNFNADKLYQLRKLIDKNLSGPLSLTNDTPALIQAARRDAVLAKQAIDAELERASAGGWQPYLDEYKRMSVPVTSARAQGEIADNIGSVVSQTGELPGLTAHRLNQALKKHGTSKAFGTDRLDPAARARYEELKQFMQRNEEVVNTMKGGGAGGSGSQTSMQNTLAMQTAPSMLGLIMSGVGMGHAGAAIGLARGATHVIGGDLRGELARMLLTPEATIKGIRAALAAGRELSPAQLAFRTAITSGSSALADQAQN